jgi:hypothetical protein
LKEYAIVRCGWLAEICSVGIFSYRIRCTPH